MADHTSPCGPTPRALSQRTQDRIDAVKRALTRADEACRAGAHPGDLAMALGQLVVAAEFLAHHVEHSEVYE